MYFLAQVSVIQITYRHFTTVWPLQVIQEFYPMGVEALHSYHTPLTFNRLWEVQEESHAEHRYKEVMVNDNIKSG